MAAATMSMSTDNILAPKHRVIGRRRTTLARPSDLVFTPSKGPADFSVAQETRRNEKARKRKAQRAGRDRVIDDADWEIPGSDSSASAVTGTQVPATIPNSTLLEHIATCRFFHHYVSADRTFCRLDLDFTSFVIDNAAMRSSLAEVVIALGILTLPRRSDASCMAARLRYARALRLTNQHLRDQVKSKSDEVLMAVILLSLFETTPDENRSVESWTAHLDGARMLLRIRGSELLGRGPTYRMFSMLRTQIILNCFMTMQPVPQDLVDLSHEISQTQEEDEKAGSEVIILLARLCGLFAASRDPNLRNREHVLAQARILDDDLINWSLALPESYTYTTELAIPGSNTYTGYCEVYSSLFCAEVWNLYRSARLGVNSIIIEQQTMLELQRRELHMLDPAEELTAGSGLDDPSNGLDVRFAVLESLRNDVCAGTPFMLGRHGASGKRAAIDIPLCKRTPVMHHLLFILKTAGITSEMQAWVMSQLAELTPDQESEDRVVYDTKTLVFGGR